MTRSITLPGVGWCRSDGAGRMVPGRGFGVNGQQYRRIDSRKVDSSRPKGYGWTSSKSRVLWRQNTRSHRRRSSPANADVHRKRRSSGGDCHVTSRGKTHRAHECGADAASVPVPDSGPNANSTTSLSLNTDQKTGGQTGLRS